MLLQLGIIGFLFIIIVYVWIFKNNPKESFIVSGYEEKAPLPNINKGVEPWNHHPIDSIGDDPVLQYPSTYMNELNNTEYTEALKRAFKIPVKCDDRFLDSKKPDDSTPIWINDGYRRAVEYIQFILKTTDSFRLCADSEKSPIQVVHDVWLSYSPSTEPKKNKYLIDTILYREPKFIGKHVQFTVIVSPNDVTVCNAQVLGVISEDIIALYPVVASDQQSAEWTNFPTVLLEPEPTILLDEATIKATVDNVQKKMLEEIASYNAIKP